MITNSTSEVHITSYVNIDRWYEDFEEAIANKDRLKISELVHEAKKRVTYDSEKNTFLHFAVLNRNEDIVFALTRAKWNVNLLNMFGEPALSVAVTNDLVGIAQRLIDVGAKCDASFFPDHVGPLHIACWSGYLDMVKMLIKAGLNVNAGSSVKTTPLHFAVKTTGDDDVCYEMVKELIRANADVNAKCWGEATPLYYAVWNNRSRAAEILLESGADPNILREDIGATALFKAVDNNSYYLTELLIKKGADVNIQDSNGRTALYYASCQDSKIAELLVKSGANLDCRDWFEVRPLGFSLRKIGFIMFEMLKMKEDGFDYDSEIKKQCRKWYLRSLRYTNIILEHGGKVNHEDKKKSALYMALEFTHHSRLIDILLTHEADIDYEDKIIRRNLKQSSVVSNPNIGRALVKHTVRYDAQKKAHKALNFKWWRLNANMLRCYVQCKNELFKMKSSLVFYSVSLYDLFIGKIPRFYLRTRAVERAFKTNYIIDSFPIYGNYLIHRWEEEQKHQPHAKRAMKGLCYILNWENNFDVYFYILDKIIDTLTVEDMINLSSV